jgi:hypothetical protein
MAGEQLLAQREFQARRIGPITMTKLEKTLGLVDRHPVADAITQALCDDGGILGEPRCRVAIQPAAPVVERGGVVPVEECHKRPNVGREQRINEAVVEVEPAKVDSARGRSIRQDARPGDAEAVGLQADIRHEADVVRVSVVVIARHIARLIEPHIAWRVRPVIPDVGASSILARGPFDLIGTRRCAPDETLRKCHAVAPTDDGLCSARCGGR